MQVNNNHHRPDLQLIQLETYRKKPDWHLRILWLTATVLAITAIILESI